MYIDVCIGGVSANFLVDTGATLSIVSTSFYDKLTKKPISELLVFKHIFSRWKFAVSKQMITSTTVITVSFLTFWCIRRSAILFKFKSDRYGSSRVIQRRNKQTKPNVSIIDEAGMYIDVCIGGVSANFLVDTGATLSIVSTSFYDKLTKKPILQEFSQQITSADGGCLSVKGKGEFIFEICENSFQIKAVVANRIGLIYTYFRIAGF
jgi:predicted aspartyl protease